MWQGKEDVSVSRFEDMNMTFVPAVSPQPVLTLPCISPGFISLLVLLKSCRHNFGVYFSFNIETKVSSHINVDTLWTSFL